MKPDAPRETATPAPEAMPTTPGAALRRGTGSGDALGRAREPLPTRVSETAPLPAAFETALDTGLRQLGLELSRRARDAIRAHARLLLAWTASLNLTAIREPADVARLHVLDSLAALPLLRHAHVERFVDLGSGGGYPGVPLAAASGARVLLVDSVAKKARFLEVVADAVRPAADLTVAAGRAEALAHGGDRERWPLVTARAVASLAELVELAFPLLEPGGRLIAWKRGDIDDELAAARRALVAAGGGRLTVHDVAMESLPAHRLVELEKRGLTPMTLPRDPAVRGRRPW